LTKVKTEGDQIDAKPLLNAMAIEHVLLGVGVQETATVDFQIIYLILKFI
jgi:hypothetical protein